MNPVPSVTDVVEARLGMARDVLGLEPIASASVEDVADAAAPAFQCYLAEQIDLQKGEA